MNFGIIANDDFFKTSSRYIARQIAGKLIEAQHEVFVFNKTLFSVNIPNTKPIKVEGLLSKLFTRNLFEQSTIKALQKQHGIDRVLVFDVDDILKTKIPQTLILNSNQTFSTDALERLKSLDGIVTFSETKKKELIDLKPDLSGKILISGMPVEDGVKAFSYNEKLAAKEQFAQEKEYFVFTDFELDEERFLNLLKAFSTFKKMLQTNCKLVVYLRSGFVAKELEEILKPLSNFKYRTDVNIINDHNDGALYECLSGAYAHISTTENVVFNLPVLEVLLCGVPSVARNSATTAKYSEAVLEISNSSPESIAEKMIFLYKNESLRSRLSQNAEELTLGYNRDSNLIELVSLIVR